MTCNGIARTTSSMSSRIANAARNATGSRPSPGALAASRGGGAVSVSARGAAASAGSGNETAVSSAAALELEIDEGAATEVPKKDERQHRPRVQQRPPPYRHAHDKLVVPRL